jgi:ABC-type oligopeptide transport system ATPase subunit
MSIVNLFKRLRDDLRVSIVYITHDLATAYYISDRIIIMQKGVVVESGPAQQVLDNPQHPYSILLKNSVLTPETIGEGILGGRRSGEGHPSTPASDGAGTLGILGRPRST